MDATPAVPSSTPPRIPPGPRGLPLLGVALDIQKDVLGWNLRTAKEYGPVVQYRFGPLRSYLVTDPDGLKHVLQDHVKNYTKDHFGYAIVRRIVGNGIFTSEGATWLRQRRLAQPAFHRTRISAMAAQMVKAAHELSEHWAASQRSGERRLAMNDMMSLTLRFVGEALLGTRHGNRKDGRAQHANPWARGKSPPHTARASMMLNGLGVGTTRVSWNRVAESRVRNSSTVRSRPPVSAIIARSIVWAMEGPFPSSRIVSTSSSFPPFEPRASRQTVRMRRASSSFQSWMIHLRR